MINNPQILKIFGKEIISFNDGNRLVIIDNGTILHTKFRAKLLGVIHDSLIALINNKYIASLDFPSFALNKVLHKGPVDAYTCSSTTVWFLQQNMVYRIDSDMQVSLYDDFTHTQLVKIDYLCDLATLVFITTDKSELKVHFENSILPTFTFSDISSIPEISFESKYGIILSIGRSVLEYNIQHRKLQTLNETTSITLEWNSISIALCYKITATEITISEKEVRTYKIDADIWKIINTGSALYLFSDSMNIPLRVDKINTDGHFSRIYSRTRYDYSVYLEASKHETRSLLLQLLPNNNSCKNKSSVAIFFIHGGPHQKAGNSWDPLLSAFLQKNYPVYVPQYPGTTGTKDSDENYVVSYGIDDFKDLSLHYDQIKQTHQKIILVGHSYGAFLGLKLFLKMDADILVGINGVYDLQTISSLNPKTYAHLDEQEKTSRSPICVHTTSERCGEWHHIQFEHDPLIKTADLDNSLDRVGGKGPTIHYLNFCGHGTFDRTQSSQIVELTKMIEHQFYNPSNRQNYEQVYC